MVLCTLVATADGLPDNFTSNVTLNVVGGMYIIMYTILSLWYRQFIMIVHV